MRVIIVGGGIGGLTMANALEKAGIDFVMLEARARFDPQVGASIGLGPGAMRIFDQIGAADAILDHTAPVQVSKVHRRDGKLIMPPSPAFQLVQARFGYGVRFLERQLVLRALANCISQTANMLLSKVVQRIDHSEAGIMVHCQDGSSYHGDIVIGCDGINSKASTRAEMFRLASEADPHYLSAADRTEMCADYKCLFGISNPMEGFEDGDVDTTIDKGRSLLAMTGKNGRVFWSFHEELDKRYYYGAADYPKYSTADAEELALANASQHCNERLTLGDLWENRICSTLVPLEEGLFDKWSWGRIALLGDNTHKMTPNYGQGGSTAVESAAALANELKTLQNSGVVNGKTIAVAFAEWQKKRKTRVEATTREAAAVCRMQALNSIKAYILAFYVMPNATELLLNLVTGSLIGSEILEYLPVPSRSFEGSCPFNPKQGVGHQESTLKRAATAVPLLLISLWIRSQQPPEPVFQSLSFPSILQLTEGVLIYAIWLIEANRRGNAFNIAKFPFMWAVLSVIFGTGIVAPCYFFCHYVCSTVEKFAALDMRLTEIAYTQTILPLSIGLLGVAAMAQNLTYSPTSSLGNIQWIWGAIAALIMSIVPSLLMKIGVTKSTMHADSMGNQLRDLPYTRTCIHALTLICGVAWVACLPRTLLAGESWMARFIDGDYTSALRDIKLEETGLLLSAVFWLMLLIRDLKQAGMVESSWVKLVSMGLALGAVGGPAVVFGLGFMWREETLATKREKHAITREKYAEKSMLEVGLARGRGMEKM
ncbi:FAD binding domain protein [Penicillium brevicompactum]|uniref:FAD binding domain protein n=1 Tax=Penicillium brevicompactum TaxID=5074 RepID=A0A9W9QVG9_PENBR|nr:FAD binding domain protein [Penicillium brevicompactum]